MYVTPDNTLQMKRVYLDMDNVLVDFRSGIDRIDKSTRLEYEGHLALPGDAARPVPLSETDQPVHPGWRKLTKLQKKS